MLIGNAEERGRVLPSGIGKQEKKSKNRACPSAAEYVLGFNWCHRGTVLFGAYFDLFWKGVSRYVDSRVTGGLRYIYHTLEM